MSCICYPHSLLTLYLYYTVSSDYIAITYYVVVTPYLWGICSKTLSGCLKMRIVLNPYIYCVFSVCTYI